MNTKALFLAVAIAVVVRVLNTFLGMKFLTIAKDGGSESHVTGLFIVEIKWLFSIVLLHFRNGTREAFHSHAFNALTWFLRGRVEEHRITDPKTPEITQIKTYRASWKPKFTKRDNHHKVVSIGETWALSLRGPWSKTWREYSPEKQAFTTLTNGRTVLSVQHVPEKQMIRGFPRRNRLEYNTEAELAIRAAVDKVEAVGAHPWLTDAVVLLSQAREKLADYVDHQLTA